MEKGEERVPPHDGLMWGGKGRDVVPKLLARVLGKTRPLTDIDKAASAIRERDGHLSGPGAVDDSVIPMPFAEGEERGQQRNQLVVVDRGDPEFVCERHLDALGLWAGRVRLRIITSSRYLGRRRPGYRLD